LLENSVFPVVLTVQDVWDKKLSTIRSKCFLIEFKGMNYLSIFNALKKVCDGEKLPYNEDALKSLARRCGGDLRAAVNDLQSLERVDAASINTLSDRGRVESMFDGLFKVLKGKDTAVALTAFDNVEEDDNERVLWVDENLPKEYKDKDLARAYNCLSRSDVFRGRIMRRQHWHFLFHASVLMTAGICAAKDERSSGFTKYSPPQRLLKIWRANMKYGARKSIAEKIALATHCSKKRAIASMPLFKSFSKDFVDELKLSPEEVEWLKS